MPLAYNAKRRYNNKKKAVSKTKRRYNKRSAPKTSFKNKVLKVLQKKLEPKFVKTPLGATFITNTQGTQNNCSFLSGTTNQDCVMRATRFHMPDTTLWSDTTTLLGDGRRGYEAQALGVAESNQQKITLTRLAARLNINTSNNPDMIFQWWIINTPSSDYTEAEFSADLKNTQIVAPIYSVKSVYTQRAIQNAEDKAKGFKVLAKGLKLIKRSNDDIDRPSRVQIKASYNFGQKGKVVQFNNSGDDQGDIGGLYLVTCVIPTSGIPGTNSSSRLAFNGVQSVYFTDIIGQ